MDEIERIRNFVEMFSKEKQRIYGLQKKLFILKPGKYIYLIQLGDTEIYKIGISNDPHRRIKQLQSKCPIPLKLIFTNFGHDYEFAEKYLHSHFRHQRIKGEWFKLSAEDILQITVQLFPIQHYGYPEDCKN